MTRAAEKIEDKIIAVENKIRDVKALLAGQDKNIRLEILTIKEDFLKDFQDLDDWINFI